jgi:hypothetical protein
MASNPKALQRRLMKKYNIHFDGPEPGINSSWPVTRKTIFEHIQKLGKTEYHRYQESISCDVLQRPWKEQVRQRAERTVETVKSCLDGRKNEAGWRLAVEPIILKRISYEVAWYVSPYWDFIISNSRGSSC